MAVRFNPDAMRVKLRRRTRAVQPQQRADHDALVRELQRSLFASADFQQMIGQLEQRLARSLIQQLAVQPLRQIGHDLGAGARDFLTGGDDSFAPSASQTGALLRRLLDDAEDIL